MNYLGSYDGIIMAWTEASTKDKIRMEINVLDRTFSRNGLGKWTLVDLFWQLADSVP